VPRAATTADVFNAIAEPRRRQIIDLLSQASPRSVGELTMALKLRQPDVSKHLSVLRQVGVVSVAKQGKHRLYELNGQQLKPVHDWVKGYERFWTHQLKRIKERAERTARNRSDAKQELNDE
jgi:DNA-binding transcriptional ArsR family regulator